MIWRLILVLLLNKIHNPLHIGFSEDLFSVQNRYCGAMLVHIASSYAYIQLLTS